MLRSFASLPRASLQRAAILASPRAHVVAPRVTRQMINNIARAIATSAPRAQATAITTASKDDAELKSGDSAEPSSLSDYVKQYGGWYPLIGLGGFIAISKELLVLNEEFLMVSNFAAFIFLSWLAVGDTVHTMVKDQAAAIAKQHDDASDLYIESIEAVIKAYENQQAIVPLLQSLKTEYSALNSQVTKAKEMRARQAARDAAVARLHAVFQREQSEKAKALAAVYANAYAKVRGDLEKLDDREKANIIDFAIDVIGGKRNTIDEQHDPVRRLYNKYLTAAPATATGAKQQQRV